MDTALDRLSWELSVLSRAVTYTNLSGAAAHVGLSQPQLSRIVAKLESELRVVLLDRSVRRKSSWTPLAHRIAETYSRTVRNLSGEFQRIIEGTEPRQLTVGTLEGLLSLAIGFMKIWFDHTEVRLLELDVYDLNLIEELFAKGDLDLIFTSREPGRRKLTYSRTLGYQSLMRLERPGGVHVRSSFEFASHASKKRGLTPADDTRTLISNSLAVRKLWIETYGGDGTLPSPIRRSREKSDNAVYLIGSEGLSPAFWRKISELKPSE